MGEREQKRLYHAPLADSIAGQPYPWVYYLLGGSKDQLAVWHGQQMTSPFCDTVRQRNVFLYPTEYLTNGIGWNGVHEDITPIITKPDGSKEYRISDHLASLRVSLTSGTPTKYYDYDPWGNLLGGTTPPRRGFNDNEEDKENGLYSLGVRKYEEGRFLSVDVLFEKEPEISPYVYAGNAPMNYVDPAGLQRRGVAGVPAAIFSNGDLASTGGGAFGGVGGGGVRSGGGGGIVRSGGGKGLGSGSSPEHIGARSRAAALRSYGAQPGVGGAGASAASNMGAQGAAGGASSGGGKGGSGGGNSGSGGGKQTGSYTNTHQSGSRYHGKGGKERSQESGKRVEKEHNDPHTATDWKPSANSREAFKDEARRIRDDGGVENPQNYNRVNSPGAKYLQQDGTP